MKQLKNKILIKVNRKLIFIISILMIVGLNLFGKDKEEGIEIEYYYYTNKLYHSTLKTEIIPSEYVFITTYSNKDKDYNHAGENLYSYIYNLKTKEKKLFYIYKSYDNREYYDINGNLTTNWTDTNMEANYFYEITNNRFGETFYNYPSGYRNKIKTIRITKTNDYIQKAYKYSLTQPEIINKNDRGIYLFNRGFIISRLCFQNECYEYTTYGKDYIFEERGLLNYDSNGRIIINSGQFEIKYSCVSFNYFTKKWDINRSILIYNDENTNASNIYFKLNDKSLIKPTWNGFTNSHLNYFAKKYYSDNSNFHYSEEDIEYNLNLYKRLMDIKFLGYIPIEEFEYYLLAD